MIVLSYGFSWDGTELAIFGGYENNLLGLLVFWLKKVSYHFVKPMVGFKAEQFIAVVESLVEIVFAWEDRPWPRSSRSTT